MSSNAYSAVIYPDPVLRLTVLASGVVLGMVGAVLIVNLPFSAALRIGALLLWCLSIARELFVLHRAWQDCRAIRVTSDGGFTVLGTDDGWRPARLLSGSVLLPRLGWIRLRGSDGRCFAECVRGDRRRSDAWRRLHVIWRHFGDPA